MLVIFPAVIFPICNEYLPKRWKALEVNTPVTPAIGTPVYEAPIAKPELTPPTSEQTALAQKKTRASRFCV